MSQEIVEPLFSLVLATLGKRLEILRLIESICTQAVPVELIVVDQNPDSELVEKLACFRSLIEIVYLRAAPGLSHARNLGLQFVRGRIVAFPDDDCWYPAGLLKAVAERFGAVGVSGLTCRCTDERGRLAAGGDDPSAGAVTMSNVWSRGVSATLFLDRNVVRDTGGFDEELGLGSAGAFQSGEETDYILRALSRGWRIYYDPKLCVHHPLPPPPGGPGAVLKSWAYGLGMGRVLRKHGYPMLAVGRHVAIPFVGTAAALACGNPGLARLRWARTCARWRGWRWRRDQGEGALAAPRFIRNLA